MRKKIVFTLIISMMSIVPINGANADAGVLINTISAPGDTGTNSDVCNWPTGTNQPGTGSSGYAAKIDAGSTDLINAIELQASNPSGNTGDVEVAIYNDNNGDLGSTKLATFGFSEIGASLGSNQYVVKFTGAFQAVMGTSYWVSVYKTGASLSFCGGLATPVYGNNWSYNIDGNGEYRNAFFPSTSNYNFWWPKHLNMKVSGIATETPWAVSAAQSSNGSGTATTAATQIVGSDNYVELTASEDYVTAGTVTVLKVSGATINYTSTAQGKTPGILNSALTEITYADEAIGGNKVRIPASTIGTVTAKYYSRVVTNGVPTDTLKQTITITISNIKNWSSRFSTAVIDKTNAQFVAGSDESDILAPKGSLNAAATKVATIVISFKDETNTNLSSPTGTYPTVRAVVSGPGNIQFNGENAVGRDITIATPTQNPTIDIFNDGTAGSTTISIYVGGVLWKTKTLKFYGSVTSLSATQGLYVASTAGGAWGCGSDVTVCDGTTVAKTPAAVITATDALGIPVPFLTLTALSSDTSVFASSSTVGDNIEDGSGVYNADVVAVPNGTSGKTATITYRTLLADGVTYVSASPLTFAIGGAAASTKFTVEPGDKAGSKGSFTISKTDAAGNKAFDNIHKVAFESNVVVTASIFPASGNTQSGSWSYQLITNGAKTWEFFNPLIAANVTFGVKVDSLEVNTANFVVGSAAQDAQDAANEATDAANAATDAANAAAEAADAATAAAQEAQAAVTELANQVSALIAGVKKQIIALTNLIIKIQKKMKA